MIPKVLCFLVHLLLVVLLADSYGARASDEGKVVNVGAILDFNSRIGREQRAAMEIAARSFNDSSKNFKLLLNFQDSGGEALRAASSAKQMIEEKKADVIVGMGTWQEAAIVGKVGNQTQVPIISLVAPSIIPPQMQLRWPFLVTMANDASTEVICIANLVQAYKWRKVIVIYEDEEDGDDFGTLSLLSKALQNISSEIEYRLVLPPYSSLSNPKEFVLDELVKLLSVQSRAFIVLRTSLPMVSHLFREAKKLGLLESDSAWIITERITSLLNSVDNAIIPFMKGTLGIKTYYSNVTSYYKDFHRKFQQAFGEANQDNLNLGIYALRAHDSIQAITQAMERMASNNNGNVLLENILSANFDGLSGKVIFREGKLLPNPILRIINVDGNRERQLHQQRVTYKELNYWMPECGFFKSLETKKAKIEKQNALDCNISPESVGSVVWPGNLDKRNPKGWAVPTIAKPLRIGVPGRTQFRKFVRVDESKKYLNEGYDGLCIQIFRMALKMLNYDLPFQFYSVNGTYDELVEAVRNQTYDAAVGDITILASRSKGVEFTQPYLESGLSIIIPIKSEQSAWIFMRPFTWEVWVATCGILVYTMLIVWFLEHPTNPEFSGPLKNQIGTTFWFTFSSIFFAQRERIHSNITKVAITTWLSLVFILVACYTANLSSMLTVKQLKPNIDIEWLKSTNQKVGCDNDSFIRRYLEEVLDFKHENIYSVPSEYDYVNWFAKKKITAAFLEQPYEKVFLNENCNKYTTPTRTYRFGGIGFVFQKGSPIARDISEVILKLSENGDITALEKQCLMPNDCSQNSLTNQTESLSIKYFWGIYLMSGTTSTICFLISLIRLQKKYHRHQQASDREQPMKNNILGLARYFYNGEAIYSPGKASTTSRTKTISACNVPNLDEWSSSRWEFVSTSDIPDYDLNTYSPSVVIENPVEAC